MTFKELETAVNKAIIEDKLPYKMFKGRIFDKEKMDYSTITSLIERKIELILKSLGYEDILYVGSDGGNLYIRPYEHYMSLDLLKRKYSVVVNIKRTMHKKIWNYYKPRKIIIDLPNSAINSIDNYIEYIKEIEDRMFKEHKKLANDFLNMLSEKGIDFKDFEDLYFKYHCMSVYVRDILKEMYK